MGLGPITRGQMRLYGGEFLFDCVRCLGYPAIAVAALCALRPGFDLTADTSEPVDGGVGLGKGVQDSEMELELGLQVFDCGFNTWDR